jgi:hypothetical protein
MSTPPGRVVFAYSAGAASAARCASAKSTAACCAVILWSSQS